MMDGKHTSVHTSECKVDAENAWNTLYASRGAIRAKTSTQITTSNVKVEIDALESYYGTARNMGATMDNMLQNSVIGG